MCRLLVVFALATSLALPTVARADSIFTEGSGKIKQEKRNLTGFHAVKIQNGFETTISVGGAASVSVSAEDNFLQYVKITVKGGELWARISTTKNLHSNSTKMMQLKIVMPTLDSVTATNGTKIAASGVSARSFAMHCESGSKCNASGKTQTFNLHLDGGTTADTSKLAAKAATARLKNGAHATVRASTSIDAKAENDSHLVVLGKPPSKNNVIETGSASTIDFR